ncbi:MAG: CinA family protein [Aestuariivirga sp.]|jgi:nicotinamide-nucleotide amidase
MTLEQRAMELLEKCRQQSLKLATAESCTGGMVAALLTSIAGSSDVFDCGFVTYSNEAKERMLGISCDLIAEHGAVSRECALAMAHGAILKSVATLVVSITGIAGPSGGSEEKPVGLVHFACARRNGATQHREMKFGDIGRAAVRLASVDIALDLLETQLR